MGTRNLTMVISNNETKVAQYGQYDGYPSGQGLTALKFLRNCDNLSHFKEKVDKLHFFTPNELKALEKRQEQGEEFEYLHRDAAAEILNAIYSNEMDYNHKVIKVNVEGLINDESFAGDSLFCEWAYVIDLDNQVFEVYEGFNHNPLTETDRFFKHFNQPEHRDTVYYPVKLVKTYLLSELPTDDQFIADLETAETE